MTHAEREAEFLAKIARLRVRVTDLAEELAEAGLDRTANRVLIASHVLNDAKQTLMTALRKVDDR